MTRIDGAKIVIVGGGAVGCGVAFSLARAGHNDVLLLEREASVAAATSAQAAGLVGQVRNSLERTQLAMWSVKTFSELEFAPEAVGPRSANVTARPSWRQVGSLRVAMNDERAAEFAQMLRVADEAGLEVHEISADDAASRWPGMDFRLATQILWCPTDGYLQPYDLTMTYAAHAKAHGVRFQTSCLVKEVLTSGGRVVGIRTDRGEIECDTVINAAGAHAYHLAKSVGIELPIVPVRHEFFVTVAASGLRPDLPVIRIPDATLYLRAETNALLCGGWEPSGVSADPRAFSVDATAPMIEPDWEVLGRFAEELAPYFPTVNQLGIRNVFKGWPTFVPDGRFIIGPSCRLEGFVMAGGCNAHGVSGSAGIGRHVVESMFAPEPSEYVRSLSPDRFTEESWEWESARRQAQHVYETYYCLGH
ncbi:MAG: FAD-binding oxidoreductase [Pirellulaceae bacterium]|nr:FAD-binding oxidoreductase [Planctomycetales bacterium]